MTTDLSTYGTGEGLKTWSFDDRITAMLEKDANEAVMRSQRYMGQFGPFNVGKTNAAMLLTDLVYNMAELMWYFGRTAVGAIAAPFQSESIGLYRYTMGSRTMKEMMEEHPFIPSLLLYLHDISKTPIVNSTRIVHTSEVNPETGIREIIDSWDDRTARAIELLGYISDTEDFHRVVYGDKAIASQ